MDHKKSIASIKVIRKIGKDHAQVLIEMPIWFRRDANGRFYANLALLGGLTTYGDSEADLDVAIREAIMLFFKAAKEYGKGVQNELKELGWQMKSSTSLRYKARRDRPVSYNLPVSGAYAQMMQTGVSKSFQVDVAA